MVAAEEVGAANAVLEEHVAAEDCFGRRVVEGDVAGVWLCLGFQLWQVGLRHDAGAGCS
jgi:hypothetical protein